MTTCLDINTKDFTDDDNEEPVPRKIEDLGRHPEVVARKYNMSPTSYKRYAKWCQTCMDYIESHLRQAFPKAKIYMGWHHSNKMPVRRINVEPDNGTVRKKVNDVIDGAIEVFLKEVGRNY